MSSLDCATKHNYDQPLIKILSCYLSIISNLDILFQTCKNARSFRKCINLSFNNTIKFIENEIYRNKVLQFLSGNTLKLQLSLLNVKYDLSTCDHDIRLFGKLCKEHSNILVKCNKTYILNINTRISRYIYSNKKNYQIMLHYIKYIKKIYSNCEINLNWSRIRKTPFELPPISEIHGINLSNTSITNETLKGKTLPRDTDITFCDGITTLDRESFATVEKLKLSLTNINPYEIPNYLRELHIVYSRLTINNLYENQFPDLIILHISNMTVNIWTWIIPNLRILCLERCTFTTYENIANFLLLEELTISGCNFDNTHIQHILHLSKLNKLDISNCTNLTDFSFIPQIRLHSLNVSGCNITNDTLQYFRGITDLNLSHTKITDLTMLDGTIVSLMALNVSHCNLIRSMDFFFKQRFSKLNISESSIEEIDPLWNVETIINIQVSRCNANISTM